MRGTKGDHRVKSGDGDDVFHNTVMRGLDPRIFYGSPGSPGSSLGTVMTMFVQSAGLDVHRIEEAARLAAPDAGMKLPVLRRHGLVLDEVPFAIDDEFVLRLLDAADIDGMAVMPAAAAPARLRIADAGVPVMRFGWAEQGDEGEGEGEAKKFCCRFPWSGDQLTRMYRQYASDDRHCPSPSLEDEGSVFPTN